MPAFIAVFGCQKIAVMLAMASMITRSALSANPIDSIFISLASAFARV